MAGHQERYEAAETLRCGVLEEHNNPMCLTMELLQKITALEQRFDALYRSCEAEEWF